MLNSKTAFEMRNRLLKASNSIFAANYSYPRIYALKVVLLQMKEITAGLLQEKAK